MVMTSTEASGKLRNLIKFYEVSLHDQEIPIVEVPLDRADILALQIAIESLGTSGRWIPQDEFGAYFKCSICGIVIDNDFPIWREFCPHCGSGMMKEGDPE